MKIYEQCDGKRFEVNIPTGFHWAIGNVDDGCVIENERGDQYIRIPLGYTAEGLFVRGFWLSRYEISKGECNIPRSVAGKYPWTCIKYPDAKKVAESVGASIICREEYSRILIWLLATKAATYEQIFVDGKGLGNFSEPFQIAKTGSNPNWMINRLDCFWGNCYTWTSERSELYAHDFVIRGGHEIIGDLSDTVISRKRVSPETERNDISFRMIIHDQKLYED